MSFKVPDPDKLVLEETGIYAVISEVLEAIVSLQQQTERSVLHSVLTETGGHPPF
jgi:hypothetical protein